MKIIDSAKMDIDDNTSNVEIIDSKIQEYKKITLWGESPLWDDYTKCQTIEISNLQHVSQKYLNTIKKIKQKFGTLVFTSCHLRFENFKEIWRNFSSVDTIKLFSTNILMSAGTSDGIENLNVMTTFSNLKKLHITNSSIEFLTTDFASYNLTEVNIESYYPEYCPEEVIEKLQDYNHLKTLKMKFIATRLEARSQFRVRNLHNLVKKLNALEHLEIRVEHEVDNEFLHNFIKSHGNLKILMLHGVCQSYIETSKILNELKHLEKLELVFHTHADLRDVNVKFSCPTLTCLSVHILDPSYNTQQNNFHLFDELTNLNYLYLDNKFDRMVIEKLAKCDKIKSLKVKKFCEEKFTCIVFKDLRELEIESIEENSMLQFFLASNKDIKKLVLQPNVKVDDCLLKYIAKNLLHLECLEIHNASLLKTESLDEITPYTKNLVILKVCQFKLYADKSIYVLKNNNQITISIDKILCQCTFNDNVEYGLSNRPEIKPQNKKVRRDVRIIGRPLSLPMPPIGMFDFERELAAQELEDQLQENNLVQAPAVNNAERRINRNRRNVNPRNPRNRRSRPSVLAAPEVQNNIPNLNGRRARVPVRQNEQVRRRQRSTLQNRQNEARNQMVQRNRAGAAASNVTSRSNSISVERRRPQNLQQERRNQLPRARNRSLRGEVNRAVNVQIRPRAENVRPVRPQNRLRTENNNRSVNARNRIGRVQNIPARSEPVRTPRVQNISLRQPNPPNGTQRQQRSRPQNQSNGNLVRSSRSGEVAQSVTRQSVTTRSSNTRRTAETENGRTNNSNSNIPLRSLRSARNSNLNATNGTVNEPVTRRLRNR